MSTGNQLRQEAAQLRGRIDGRACLARQRIDSLMHRIRALARSPAALPIAFAGGVLAQRLYVSDIKCSYGFLASQMKAIQIISSLIGLPIR